MSLQATLHRFLDILLIEIEDLENDLLDLIQVASERFKRHEITNYVFLENKGLLVNELACLKSVMGGLRHLDTSAYADVKDMVADVERRIRTQSQACGHPEAVFSLVKRRLDKVYRYLNETG